MDGLHLCSTSISTEQWIGTVPGTFGKINWHVSAWAHKHFQSCLNFIFTADHYYGWSCRANCCRLGADHRSYRTLYRTRYVDCYRTNTLHAPSSSTTSSTRQLASDNARCCVQVCCVSPQGETILDIWSSSQEGSLNTQHPDVDWTCDIGWGGHHFSPVVVKKWFVSPFLSLRLCPWRFEFGVHFFIWQWAIVLPYSNTSTVFISISQHTVDRKTKKRFSLSDEESFPVHHINHQLRRGAIFLLFAGALETPPWAQSASTFIRVEISCEAIIFLGEIVSKVTIAAGTIGWMMTGKQTTVQNSRSRSHFWLLHYHHIQHVFISSKCIFFEQRRFKGLNEDGEIL